MSGQVWKFRLPSPNEEPFVIVPKRSKFLHFAAQDGIPYVWALVDPKGDLCRRHVIVYATGQAIDGSPDYLGTFHIDWTVWHVFTTYGDLPMPPPIGSTLTCGTCGSPADDHGDSDQGPMTVCPLPPIGRSSGESDV